MKNSKNDSKMTRRERAYADQVVEACALAHATLILHEIGVDVPITNALLRKRVAAGLEAMRLLSENPIARRNPGIVAEFYANYLKACYTLEVDSDIVRSDF